jgi:hypothetical protein
MSRRLNLPTADELFRATSPRPREEDDEGAEEKPQDALSGRIKHNEKMTVYLTSDELLAIEQARLTLRGELGRNVDRGRLVRAALAIALDDLETRGTDSEIAQRLSAS